MPFDNTGRYASIRKLYFRERNEYEMKKLNFLCRDLDYLCSELRRISIQTGEQCLISTEMLKLIARLRYWEYRQAKYTSDRACFLAIAKELNRCMIWVQLAVFDPAVKTLKWLK